LLSDTHALHVCTARAQKDVLEGCERIPGKVKVLKHHHPRRASQRVLDFTRP